MSRGTDVEARVPALVPALVEVGAPVGAGAGAPVGARVGARVGEGAAGDHPWSPPCWRPWSPGPGTGTTCDPSSRR
jgi:hypothetical protein